ncbi:MAG: CARDB domain-containing protein, partial [Methanosarcinales archaeon]
MNENTILREKTTRKISGVFLSLMICLACVAPAIATTPFVISGDVSDSSGDPCNNSVVQITNLNTNATWTVNTTAGSNHYELNLTSSDVSAGDILQIDASGCSESATVKHTVTASEINNSGFVEDITLEPSAKPDLTITGKMEEWVDLGNRTYNIVYTVENTGAAGAGESETSISIDGAVSLIGDPVPALAVGESYTSTVGPFTISDSDDVIIVCADKGNVVDESNETNN